MRLRLLTIVLILMACLLPLHSQDRTYKVEFDIYSDEGNGQKIQHLSVELNESRKGILQAATRIPVAPDSLGYVDAGVKIECAVQESDGKVTLHSDIKLTSITGEVRVSGISQPIIGEKRVTFQRILDPGTRTIVVSPGHATPMIEARVTRAN